ncbi:hypothetical protein BDV96DRAFT_646792 [Lophiotrema nucula]|uniref:Uncharacterized protein n=1 Tax=Lophiotrema nucula TaxID=690887 RepID=A0A6A5Z6Y6_9PLEO|nr:hypothetical protein BDV96DRAFT_646792 [Lophiotrema nucula]
MDDPGEAAASNAQFLAIWRIALDDYRTQTHHDLTKLEPIKNATDLSDTMLKTEEHFKISRKGSSKYETTRNILKSCVRPLQSLSSVASSAVSLTPFAPAATIFGAGMYLIEACNNVSEAYDLVIELLEECKTYIDRLGKYTEVKVDDKFLIKLTAILKFILEVFGRCEMVMSRGRTKLWFDKVATGQGKDEILKDSLARLRRYFSEEEMNTIAQVYVTGEKTASKVSELVYFDQMGRVQNVIETLHSGPFDVAAKQAEDNSKSEASPPDWIDKNELYQAWINGTSPQHRWLWGIGSVGVGKTSLVSYLTGRLKVHVDLSKHLGVNKAHFINSSSGVQSSQRPLQQRAVALFYGDYETKDEQRPELVFQCLIRQLLQQLRSSAIGRAMVRCDQIQELRNLSTISTRASKSASWTSVLDDIASEFQQTFIIVDGLDREESGYETLVSRLDQLMSPSVKLLVTSRDEQSMRDDALFRKAMPMTIHANTEFIGSYVRKRLTRIRARIETTETIGASALPGVLADVSQFDRIAELIVSTSQGNFYYAEVQINSLIGERTPERVQQKLTVLTGSLADVIRLDVDRISEQRDDYKREVGLKAILLATFAGMPLSIEAFRHAVVLLLDPSTRANHKAHLSKVNALTTGFLIECSYRLLKIDDRTGMVQVDEAIKNYCNTSDKFDRAHYEIAEICLSFLDHMSFSLRCKTKDECLARKQEHPFYDYAARFWGYHMIMAGENLFIGPSSPVSLFTLLNRKLFLNTVAAAIHEQLSNLRMWDWAGNDTWKAMADGAEPVLWPMHLLTIFGLSRIADWWLRQRQNPKHDVERKSATGTTPLYLACALSRVRMVEVLLFDYHADPTIKGTRPSGYCLAAAVMAQSAEIVERLLYVNSKEILEHSNQQGRRPLAEAVIREDMSIVRMIIEASVAAPNGEDLLTSSEEKDGWTALHEVAGAPHPSIEAIKMLVEARGGRALLQRRTHRWKDTALHLAAVGGKHQAVKTLLDLGADPGVGQSQGKTPLMLAAQGLFVNNEQCIRTLMKWTRDHHLSDNDGNTTWHLATIHGRYINLALLIKLTPESLFNVKNKNGATPIRVAVNHRRHAWRECIVTLLRDCSPGQLAAEDAYAILEALIPEHSNVSTNVNIRALRILLKQRIEPWPFSSGNTTVLHKIVHHGSFEAVKLVWDIMGSKEILEYHDAGGSTPLILAAIISAVDKASFLLGEGADPNGQDKKGCTALHYAVKHGLADLAAALLDRGASFHIRNNEGATALELVESSTSCGQLPQVVAAKRSLSQHK